MDSLNPESPEISETLAPVAIPAGQAHVPEETVWAGQPSHWNFFWQWVFGIALAALLMWGMIGFRADLTQSYPKAMPWLYAIPVLVLLCTWMTVSLKRRNHRYSITTRRVIVESGLVVSDSNEIRVQDIRSINVTKGAGIAGLLGVGNVEFSSAAADDADVIFMKIGGADGVRDLVRKLQD